MGLEASDWKVFHDTIHTLFYGTRALLILAQDVVWLMILIFGLMYLMKGVNFK